MKIFRGELSIGMDIDDGILKNITNFSLPLFYLHTSNRRGATSIRVFRSILKTTLPFTDHTRKVTPNTRSYQKQSRKRFFLLLLLKYSQAFTLNLFFVSFLNCIFLRNFNVRKLPFRLLQRCWKHQIWSKLEYPA